MTHDCSKMYDIRPPPPGREAIVIGDGRRLRVECIGKIEMMFHGHTEVRHTLSDVSYVPELGFNLYSLHVVQRTHVVMLDASGIHITGTGITFPRGIKRSCVWVSRLPPRSILHHPVPPSQVSPSSSHVSDSSGVQCVDSSCYGMDHGGRRLEAQGHPPVQLPQAGYPPVAVPMPVPIATAIAPAPAPAPHPQDLAAPLLFTYRQQRTPPDLATPASTSTGEMQMLDSQNPPGVAGHGRWFFGGGYSS